MENFIDILSKARKRDVKFHDRLAGMFTGENKQFPKRLQKDLLNMIGHQESITKPTTFVTVSMLARILASYDEQKLLSLIVNDLLNQHIFEKSDKKIDLATKELESLFSGYNTQNRPDSPA